MSKTFKDNKLTQGEKLRRTMIAKHGSEEAWKASMAKLASKGGKKSKGGGFKNIELAREAGRKSKRRSKKVIEGEE